MNKTVRAVYEHGTLRPLSPVLLQEGDIVELNITDPDMRSIMHAFRINTALIYRPEAMVAEARALREEIEQQQRRRQRGAADPTDPQMADGT